MLPALPWVLADVPKGIFSTHFFDGAPCTFMNGLFTSGLRTRTAEAL